MSERAFNSRLERVLVSVGFERYGKALRRPNSHVWTLVSTQKGFGQQWHVNVGFWLEALGGECARQVERTHLYFRLERLFPEHHETIALAGALGDQKQPEAYGTFMLLLQGELDWGLRALATEEALSGAMRAGRLVQGLIRKEAREYLQDLE